MFSERSSCLLGQYGSPMAYGTLSKHILQHLHFFHNRAKTQNIFRDKTQTEESLLNFHPALSLPRFGPRE